MSATTDTALQAVELARRAGASDAEAWLRTERNFSTTVREGEVEQLLEADSRVLGLRVYLGDRLAIAYSSDLDPTALAELAREAVEMARLADPDPFAGLPEGPFADGSRANSLDLYDPAVFDQDPEQLIALARRAEEAARAYDAKITNTEDSTLHLNEHATALANSKGFAGSYRATSCSLSVTVLADDEDHKKRRDYWETTERFFDRLEDPEEVGRRAAERTLHRLGPRKVETQGVPVVWSPEMARELLAYVLATAVSGQERYRGMTFLIDREGERIASPLLTLVDDATLPGRLGSRPFDGEGLPSGRTKLFEAGTFNGFLFDTYSARRAGRNSTANAGRTMAFQRGMMIDVKPSNLSMEAGASTPEDIIAGVDQGLYLTELIGFAENLTTGDFSRGAAGMWIDGGELAYPVSEINIAGRLQDMLAGIDAVGNDVSVRGNIAAPTFRMERMTVSGS